jgi:hypothetical protein
MTATKSPRRLALLGIAATLLLGACSNDDSRLASPMEPGRAPVEFAKLGLDDAKERLLPAYQDARAALLLQSHLRDVKAQVEAGRLEVARATIAKALKLVDAQGADHEIHEVDLEQIRASLVHADLAIQKELGLTPDEAL